MARSLLPFTVCVGKLPQGSGFIPGHPISEPQAQFLCSLQATDAGGQIRAEESRICRFIGESSDCCKPHVDGARCKQPVFEMNPVAGDHRFIEGQPRLRTIPANEIVDGTPIAALRFRDRRLTSTADLTCSKSGRPSLVFCRFDFLVFLLMDAPPDGENWEWHDSPSHAIPGHSRGMGVSRHQ